MEQSNQQKQITEFLIEFKSRFTQIPSLSPNLLVAYGTKLNRQDVSLNLQMYVIITHIYNMV